MEYTALGQSGIQISRLTFGCWEMGGTQWQMTSDEQNVRVISTAIDRGITTFDTAEGYGDGHSEEVLGKALAGRRNRFIVATKVSPKNLRPADVRNSITASLKRLQTDYIDLYYIHWPNKDIPLQETLEEITRLKKEGYIRAIGVSNFSAELLLQAAEIAQIDAVQPEYSLLHRDIEADLMPYCHKNGISIASYSSIAKGILTGAFHMGGKQLAVDDFRNGRRLFLPEHIEYEAALLSVMEQVAKNNECDISQVAISWLMHREGLSTAIVGTQSEKHLLSNIAALDISLTEEALSRLDNASRSVLEKIDA